MSPSHSVRPSRTRRASACLLLCGAALALAGCGNENLTRTFGLTRDAPDEFTVTTRAPLSMPPEFTLRPPRPGAARPQELSERQQAEQALVPQLALETSANAAMSPGQQALVAAAGPSAPADIRNKVNEDAQLETANRSFTERLMFWQTPSDPSVVVDPTREAQRLRENAALGQDTRSGDTPIIKRKPKSLMDRIF
jgi:hypothetical protein